ncbi:MAG TPA: PIG-L family deacetylase [Caulobacteraceae bacterium]|jgi:LmbE family N-acetylglucosaminyl deacetylase|nr:PIG-L family deacetylase [Caulobacteraceae bacterium]
MTTVLAVHAHPDDVETLCAGTLALLARAGLQIIVATLTAGECGTLGDAADTARIRRAEAASAAALIGADYLCAGLPDLGVFNDDRCRRATVELIRQARPDIVIGPSPQDYHPDHEAAGLLVRDACFAASAPAYRTGEAAPLDAIPHLYFCDAIGARLRDGSPAPADFAVDVGAVMDLKRAMLQRHVSQIAWLAKQHAMADFTAGMQAQAARRGSEFGVAFAEAFRQYRHLPYPRTPLLQDRLGETVLRAPTARRSQDASQQS